MRKFSLAAAAALVAVSAPAWAAWNIDEDGYGFVGKGDVQLLFGWNNKTLQDNAKGITFSYHKTETITADCEFETTNNSGRIVEHLAKNIETITGIDAALNGDPRQVKGQTQFTGFDLNGWNGDPVIVGGAEYPVEGEACKNPDANGIVDSRWVNVSAATVSGGLYVTFGGTSKLLP